MPEFKKRIARAVTLAWSSKVATIACRCRAGRHRSVAGVTVLRMLLEMYLHPRSEIFVEHLEKKGWGRTCRG